MAKYSPYISLHTQECNTKCDLPPEFFLQPGVVGQVHESTHDLFMTFAEAYSAGLGLADVLDALSNPHINGIDDALDDITERAGCGFESIGDIAARVVANMESKS